MDKLPLKSKKFIAYLISEISWKILLLILVLEYGTEINHYGFLVMVSVIVTSGFMQIGYVLGQSYIDKYAMVVQSAVTKKPEETKKDGDK